MGLFDGLLRGRQKDEPKSHGSVEVVFPSIERQDSVGVSIVGESHYQDALREICGRKGNEEVSVEHVAATLVPEPENPYDSNAVRVEIDGMQVGYLARDTAPVYQPRVVRLLEEGGDPTVEAYVGAQGPEGENPNIGVRLHIPKDSPLVTPSSGAGKGERHHTVEIEGFGPITVRSLSKKDMEQIHEGEGGDVQVGVALVIQRGLVQPAFTELDPAQLEGKDEVIDAIAMAIIDRSWPNVGD